MIIKRDEDTLIVSDGGLVAEVTLPLRFGHLGCKRLSTVRTDRMAARKKAQEKSEEPPPEIPAATIDFWETVVPNWKSPQEGAVESVTLALKRALEISGASAIELWDTMRGGSDYWRGGKLLSKAVEPLGTCAASFGRLEELCPTEELLGRLRKEKLPWSEYAQQYADWISEEGRIDLALGVCAFAQARGRLAVFYCTDAYIPGYGNREEWGSDTPYRDRQWPLASNLREEGCHRMVLADMVVRRCRELGVRAEVIEVDPSRPGAWCLK